MMAGAVIAMALLICTGARPAQAEPTTTSAVERVGATAAEAGKTASGVEAKAGEQASGNPLLDEAKNVSSYVFTVLVFLVLLVILRFAAWKPILQALKDRERSIREGLEAAAKARTDAEKTTRDLEAKIAEAQRAGAQALAQAKQDAQKLADSIRAQAEAESVALKDRATRDIAAAKEQAIAEINAHAAEIGTAVARKILQRDVRVEDQQRLVDESLAQLGTTKV